MAVNVVNLQMVKGDTPSFNLTITDAITTLAIDLTGSTIWMTAKKEFADTDAAAVFQKSTTGGGITITDAVNGLAKVTLVNGDTNLLEGFFRGRVNLKYDIQIKTAAGQIFTVARGMLEVFEEATEAIA